MPIVEIQGLGNVEFPDTMSQEDIVKAIQSNIMPKIQATQPAFGVGEQPITPSILKTTPKEKSATNTALDVAKDLGISGVQGALGLKEAAVGLASIPTLGLLGKTEEAIEKGIFGGTSKDAREALQKLKSPELQSEEAKVSQTFKDKGVMAGLEEAVTSPRVLAGTITESLPSMIGGAAIGRQALKFGAKALGAEVAGPSLPGYLTRKFGDKIAPIIAGAGGESLVSAGSSAESTRQQNESGLLTPQQAALSTLSGGLTGAFGILGGKVANKLGIGDIDTMLVRGTTKEAQDAVNKVQKSRIRKAFEGALSESTLEELPQSLQEQALQNVAQGREWTEGLAEAGTMGFLAGGIMGGGAAAISKNVPAPTIQDLHKIVKDLDEAKKGELEGDYNLPPEKIEPQVRTVSQEQLMGHATTRLAELDAKANGVPAKETVDENGNTITVPEVPAQPMTEQEASEYKFLQEQMGDPQRLAEGYGVKLGEVQVTGSQDTEASLGELEGKEMPVSPIFQQPAKPAEPEVTAPPETPPAEEGAPEEKLPEDKEPPAEEKTQAIVKDSAGTEHPLPTISDAQKEGKEYSPINSDRPMYVKTDLDTAMKMIFNLFRRDANYPNISSSNMKVTSDLNSVLPKNQNKNQVSVTFRPDTLSGREIGNNEFIANDMAHRAIESFTIHNPGLLKVRGLDASYGVNLMDQFFTRGDNPDGSITYTLRRVKSEAEKTQENEKISKDYLEHINSKRGKLTYKYKRLRRPGLNPFQEILNKHENLGSAFKDLLARLEKAIANNEYEMLFKDMNSKEQVESYSGTDPVLRNLSRKQVEMYIDMIKNLMKIDPVNKTKLFVDPYIIGGRSHTIPGFYNRVTNAIALFANTDMKTFIHESVHAATVHYIKTHPNDPKVKQLEKILKASRAKDTKVKSNWKNYGNTDLMEFIAESFSNPEFIKHLMNIPPVFDKTEATSLFDNLKSIVRGLMKDVFGITKADKTAFDEVMDLSDQMFTGKTLEGYKYDLGHKLDAETLNVGPIDEAVAEGEEQSRSIFNYRGDQVDIRKWEIPEQGPIATKLSKWFQEFADEHVILTKVSNAIRSLNRTISDMSDMEKKQELKNSKISDQLLRFANEEVNPILKEMLENDVSMEDIKQYLHARHAEAYNNRMNDLNHRVDENGNIMPYALKDRASGMSTQDANDYLTNLSEERENVLKNIAEKWYAIRNKTQQIIVDSGQETQETIDLWNEIYPDYVPLNREQEQQAMPSGLRTGVGIDTRGNFSKRALGSEKAIINPIDALLYQRERAVARAANNDVGKAVYRLALENPNPDFWLPINPDAIRSREKLIQELEDMGYANAEEIADNIMAEPKERYLRPVRESDFVIDPTTGLPIPNGKEVVDARISRNARFGDNVLTLKVNGRERYVFFNQKDPNAVTMVRSLKNLDSQTLGRFLSANRFMNHYLGQVYTVLNPIFGIVNGIRDYPFGMANLSTTPINGKQIQVSKKIFPAMMGIMGVLRKERASDGSANEGWQKIYKEATEAGFQTSNRYAILNTGEDQTYIEQTLKGFTDNNAKQVFKYVINMTYDFASMIENGVRLAAYQQMRETIDPETKKPYTPQKAASVAKNLTINFDKKGSRTEALRSLYLFFNASVRGTVRLAETLNPAKNKSAPYIISGGVLLGVMQAIMIAGAGFKDDDPPEYIRERNLIIPTGDGKYITLPMPYGLNILPNTGRILTEAAIDLNKNGFKKAKLGKKSLAWASSFFSTFSPFGNQGLSMNALVPSAVEPFAGVFLTNKNSFGQTISKQDSYKRPTPGYMRTKESGTAPGKELARWLNLFTGGTDYTKGGWSPTGDDIDFLGSSFAGPVLGSIPKTIKYVLNKVEGEEVPAYQVPVVGRFRGETDSKPVITSRFYNNLNAMYEHELTLKNLRGDPAAVKKYMQENPDARAFRRAEHVDAQINSLNAKKKKFQMRGAPDEALKRIDNQKIIIMNRFNDQLENIRKQ
jgi:hypothetical protein